MFDGDIRESDPGLSRLFARFDPLLSDPRAFAPADAEELRGMAAIFDLDAGGEPADVWRRLRPVLERQAPAVEPEIDGPTEPLTLMVVEDDPDMAADLVDALTEAGHSVVGPFHDAETALAAAALHALDLALLDINLSGAVTGVDLARALKDRWGVPALFLSGDVTAAARHAELSAGMVLKPYRQAQVLNAVRATGRRRGV